MSLDSVCIIAFILETVLEALSPYIPIYMSAKIVDELIYGKDKRQIGIYIALTVGLTCVVQVVKELVEKIFEYRIKFFYSQEQNVIADKMMQLDYERIENVETHRLLDRIKTESQTGYNLPRFLQYSSDIFNAFLQMLAAAFIVAPLFRTDVISVWIKLGFVAFTAAGIVANYYVNKKMNEIYIKMAGDFVPINVYSNYLLQHMEDYKSNIEIQMYGMRHLFADRARRIHKKSVDIMFSASMKTVQYTICGAFIEYTVKFAAYAFVIGAAIKGGITIGSIAKYVSAAALLMAGIQQVFGQIQQLADNDNYLKNYFGFFDIPSNMYHGTLPVEKRAFCDGGDNDYEIEFRDVSFRYPGAEQYALRHVSLKFRIGERMAIVGQNGSGKTTFIKLLCRLYDPTEGQILLNGIDIRKYNYDEYISVFSMVFQDFKLFSFALGQNVASCVDYDRKRAEICLKKAGFEERLNKMPRGLETCLYKDFEEDGVEISGGEAQKIAIARALYKDAPFIVLDEPTAALDPIAEAEIYSRFNEMVEDKTAIYISHRLSSCRFCDDIAVFHNGQLIQRGNHDTLIADEAGKYYELWSAQAQYYTEDSSATA